MRSNTNRISDIILANALIFLPVILFGGDIYLLIFSYLLEILIGIFFVALIIYGGYDDLNESIIAIAMMTIFSIFILYKSHGVIPEVTKLAFPGSVFKSWTFWIVLIAITGAKLFNFSKNFLQHNDVRLPIPEFYCLLFLMQSFVVIMATGAILPLADISVNKTYIIYTFAGLKIIFEICIVLPVIQEHWSEKTTYRFFSS